MRKGKRFLGAMGVVCLLYSWNLRAEEAAKKEVTFGGFVDAYYGFDFNEPTGDRQYTTQAVRGNEFALNLAFLEAKIQKEKIHGRLAFQAGTSVYSNYSGENRYSPAGSSQLADLMKYVQEGYAGYRVSEKLWIDAGIFFSHIGSEGFISRDNWNYTRSLGADYSPYYQTGVRLSYQINPIWSAQLNVINGWQNIIETNTDKALGMQVSFSPSSTFSATYNNFIGREREFRVLNEVILKWQVMKQLGVALTTDYGIQKKSALGDYSHWFNETVSSKLDLAETIALGMRLEYFEDQDQVLVVTSTPNGFKTFGASANLDWQLDPSLVFRNEVRALFSRDAVFSGKTGAKSSDTLMVSSLALSF